jgi:hypothetical protein
MGILLNRLLHFLSPGHAPGYQISWCFLSTIHSDGFKRKWVLFFTIYEKNNFKTIREVNWKFWRSRLDAICNAIVS